MVYGRIPGYGVRSGSRVRRAEGVHAMHPSQGMRLRYLCDKQSLVASEEGASVEGTLWWYLGYIRNLGSAWDINILEMACEHCV